MISFKWKNMYICCDAAVSSSSLEDEEWLFHNQVRWRKVIRIKQIRKKFDPLSSATIRNYIKLETSFIDTTYWSKEQETF
jgi:hypothetical protein